MVCNFIIFAYLYFCKLGSLWLFSSYLEKYQFEKISYKYKLMAQGHKKEPLL